MAVLRAAGSFRLLAARPFAPGEAILTIDGVVAAVPSRHSLQVGVDMHVEMPAATATVDQLDRYAWRFLNHACDPNAVIVGRELRAARAIAAWEEVTFDYTTTEFDMAEPFVCRCGADGCLGEVRGFAHLTPGQRARIASRAAPHVRELARRRGRC